MRVLIVDDEQLARMLLREFLAGHADIEIVGECANGFEAVKAIAEHDPDLVFLDIQMPKLDGFEVVELAGSKPHYLFATAYDQFALRAFEVHAIDYLLIRDGARVHVVPAAEIDYIEAQDDYVQIAAGAKTWLKNQRLSELEGQLDPGAFLRIHRSYIVKVGAIARIEAVSKDSHCAVLHSGARLPISRGSYAKVRERLG